MTISVGTGLIIWNSDNQILLVKEVKEKRGGKAGLWGIVGGMLEPDLSVTANALKEALEETGYEVTITSTVGVYQHLENDRNRISFIFNANSIGKTQNFLEHEISEIGWFYPEDIPYENLRFSHNAQMIKDAIRNKMDIDNTGEVLATTIYIC
jgi:ADP-ribose pyrophosphatase YjhB (NUDIX family)